MPRTRSLAWSELKVGVLTITAVVITAVTVFFLTGDRGFPWQRYSLKTRFASVPGLKAGSPVRVAGLDVGTVTDVVLAGEQVEVSFEVSQEVRDRITTGSVATLGSVSLLGESAVDITASASGTPIPEWGYVPQGRAAAQLSDLAGEVGDGVQNLSALIADIRGGRGTVGKLMTDEQLYAELNRFAASARALTDSLRSDRGTLGRLSERSARRRIARGLARQHRVVDPANQFGRGQPRQTVEGRCLLQVPDLRHRQLRRSRGPVEQRRRHRGQVNQRPRAVQQTQLGLGSAG